MSEPDSASECTPPYPVDSTCAQAPGTEPEGTARYPETAYALVPPGTPGASLGLGVDLMGNPAKGLCLTVTHMGETRRMARRQALRVARFVSAVTWLVAAEAASPGKMFGRLGLVEREVRAFCLASHVMAPRDHHPLVGWALGLLASVPFGPESPALDALDHLVKAGLADA